MISFEQARELVRSEVSYYKLAPYGYEGDADWFVFPYPETAGGRIAAVSKTAGTIRWINENAPEYTQERRAGDWPDDRYGGSVARVAVAAADLLVFEAVGQPRDSKGRWAGTGGGSPAAMHDEGQIRAAYTYTDSATGYRTEVDKIHRPGDPNPDINEAVRHPTVPAGRTMVTLRILDAKGAQIGEACRTVHPPSQARVNHNYLVLDPGQRGQGFATRFNDHAEQVYRANGIKMITLHADIDVGGYAWARAGYDFRNSQTRRATARMVLVESSVHPDRAIRTRFAEVARDPKATPLDFAMVGYTPGAKMWPGKEIMLGSDWQGVKRL